MDDAGVGRDDREVVERLLAPAQERVALLVALELELGVDAERVARAELVDLHRVVDDQLDRLQRVDLAPGRRPASPIASRIAARSTIAGTPVKSCSSTRAGVKAISVLGSAFASQPASASMSAGVDRAVVLVAQQVLEQDLQRERQPRDVELPAARRGGRSRTGGARPPGQNGRQSYSSTDGVPLPVRARRARFLTSDRTRRGRSAGRWCAK